MKGQPHIVRKRLSSGIAWYIYAWRGGGPLIRKVDGAKKPKLTPDDWAKITEARNAEVKDPRDSVGLALTAFRQSRYWRKKAETTKKTWNTALNKIEHRWGDVPLSVFDDYRMRSRILVWRDTMEDTPRAADIAVSVLSHFLKWAYGVGHISANHAYGIEKIYQPKDRAPVIWTADDIAAIKAVSGTQLHDAIDLGALTGFRLTDLVTLKWGDVDDLEIRKLASKTSRGRRYLVRMPRFAELEALLEVLRQRPRKPGVETLLVNSYGQSWTADGLGSTFYDARARANNGSGIWHADNGPKTGEEWRTQKRLHDLRGTFATKVMSHPSAQVRNEEMAQLMGWSVTQVDQICQYYVDQSNKVIDLTRRLNGVL